MTTVGLESSPPPDPLPAVPEAPNAARRRGPRMPAACSYALVGLFLGLGAPAGALAIRMLGGIPDVTRELRDHEFFYRYQLAGSCAVFGVAGWFLGRRADRYRRGRDLYRDLAEHDALTRLANARAFLDHHQRAVEHAARYDEPLSLLLLDVDELKGINDALGHAFGHAALVHVANVLRESKREDDVAARWGGDEFALLMRGADEAAARRQADAILARLREAPARSEGAERRISVTIGIASARGVEAAALFERADRALYAGKSSGRGRAVSHRDLPAGG